jgi:hypothetical protein
MSFTHTNGITMFSGSNRGRNNFRRNGSGSFSNGSGPVRRQSSSSANAKRNFERYIELARASALTGDRVETENYYQYAEHYWRFMREAAGEGSSSPKPGKG